MTTAELLSKLPVRLDTPAAWDAAIESATRAPVRSARGERPAEQLASLREMLEGELVGFHDVLVVRRYDGNEHSPHDGGELWEIGIPLTLFPKRDRGFSRIECIIRLELRDGGSVRIHALRPAERTRLIAKAELSGRLQVSGDANVTAGVPAAPEVAAAADVATQVYGHVEVGPIGYRAERACIETAIVGGNGARWRLDDVHDQAAVKAESHELAVVVEVPEGCGPIDAAGYLQAYSDAKWVTSTLGSVLEHIKGWFRSLFDRGIPAEAYGQWSDVLKTARG